MNSVNLVGNLTRDVEVKFLDNGTAVGNVGLAMNEKYKKGDEWVEKPIFVDLTVWKRTAEVMSEYCGRGSKIAVTGKLNFDQWEDKEGNKRSKIGVTVMEFDMLDKKGERVESDSPRELETVPVDDGDVPF